MAPLNDPQLAKLLDAAKAHGEDDDPEMEVGDLQGIIFSCWRMMNSGQRRQVLEEQADLLGQWGPK